MGKKNKRKVREDLMEKAYHLAGIGNWVLYLEDNSIYWSEEIRRLHEVEDDYVPYMEEALDFFKEDGSKRKITEKVNRAIEEGEPFDVELKLVTAKGNERWIRVVGEAEFEDGKCVCLYGCTQDIDKRKKIELQLRSTEQKLRDIIEHSTNLFYRHDTNHKLTYLSPNSEKFLGCGPEEAKVKWTEFGTDHPVNEKGIELTEKAIETGEAQPSFELQLRKTTGEVIWVKVNEAPIVKDGETVAIVGSLTDITDQKQYEERLEQMSLVASKTTDMILIMDENHTITWVNDAFEEQMGYRLEEVKGKTPGEFLQGPDTDPETVRRIEKNLENRETVREVILDYDKEGNERWIEMTMDPIFGEEGECTGFIAIERDVTDKIEQEQKLRESVKRYDIVSEATSDTIWDLDLREDVIRYNENIRKMFGYRKREIKNVGSWWRDNIHPDDRDRVMERLDRIRSLGSDRMQLEYRFKCADGSYKHIYDRAFIITDEEGEPIRMIGAMQDVSYFKEREKRARKFQEVISDISTDRSLPRRDLDDALGIVMATSAETLDVARVNIWMLDDDSMRCIASYENGALNEMAGLEIKEENYPTYFREIKTNRSIVSDKVGEDERLSDLMEDYLIPNNICSLLDTSVLTHESRQIVVCHEAMGQERNWRADEISFAGAISDQVAQLLANEEKKARDREIKNSLREKETLLSEVHHRVKNNLAVVSGLMQLQAFEEEDPEFQKKLFDSVARIRTMASIHEILYRSNNFSRVDMKKNIQELVENVTSTMQQVRDIYLNFELESVQLNVNQAIPFSLIVNEVVTNAFKHAFGDRESGGIEIRLFREEEEVVTLEIVDNGCGLPEDMESGKGGSLGLQLIDSLTTQLSGTYRYMNREDKPGTLFTLQFEKNDSAGPGHFA